MPIITSHYWNMVHGAKPEDVKKISEGGKTNAGTCKKNMAFFLKCKKGWILQAGVQFPKQIKQFIFTNFIRGSNKKCFINNTILKSKQNRYYVNKQRKIYFFLCFNIPFLIHFHFHILNILFLLQILKIFFSLNFLFL